MIILRNEEWQILERGLKQERNAVVKISKKG